MDNLTHTAVGLALARASGARTPLETATLLVSSNLPDLDILIETVFGLDRDSLFSHRGITHALAAAPIEIVVVATAVWALGRFARNGAWSAGWGRTALLASAGLVVHLLLDLSNDYGVRILLPYSTNWYAGDLNGPLDLWILSALAAGLLLPALARLHGVAGETASRLALGAAAASLLIAAGYVGVQYVSHRRALEALDALGATHPGARTACLPGSLSPFRWTGVLETETRFEIKDMGVPEGVLRTRRVFPKTCGAPIEAAARTSPRVRALLSFARFPIFHASAWTAPGGTPGHAVLVEDLRWLAPRGYVFGPCVRVWLDANLRIVREEATSWR